MNSFLWHILKPLWRERAAWFWPIWITMTGSAAISVAWVVGHGPASLVRRATEAPSTGVRSRHAWSRGAVGALTLLALLLAGYIVVSLKWEVFANYDDVYFTLSTLKGHNLGLTIWRESGRFFPLGEQEFNLIRHFTKSVAGYHALPLIQLLIMSCVLLSLDDELSITARALLTAFILVLPGTVTSFTGLIFPERNVLLWLALLVFFVKRFDRTRSVVWAVAAAVSAQFMIYYKETAFLLLCGFAAGRLVLRCRRADRADWDFHRFRDKESLLDICLFSLGILFVLYFTAVMIPHVNMQYADQQRFPLAQVVLYFVKVDLLAWLLLAAVLRRAYLIVQSRVAPWPLWDGLALGGVICFAAYIYLRLTTPYYLAPVDVIAVLYLGRLAILSWGRMHLWSKTAALALAFAALLQGVSLSAFREFERKNTIHAKAEIADVIASRYRSSAGNPPRLFFPFADVYPITEFAGYLTYQGVPVSEITDGSAATNGVLLVTKGVAKDGLCVPYRTFLCLARNTPAPGDLVIDMPDDDESLAEISPYQKEGDLLFSYEPRPRIPQWLHPFASGLRSASVRFEYRELPDRWLHASVTEWK